jgi:TRAP-type C4-dicarboxylate transport system substrate-binding protein
MKTKNLLFLGIVFSFFLVVSAILADQAGAELKLTFASTLAPKSNLELAATRYVDIISEKTKGRIQIIHHGASSLYHSKELIPAVAKNQVNIGILHVAMVGRRSPALEFIGSFGAQGCWESYEHYYRFLDAARVREIAAIEFDKYFNGELLGALAFGTGLVGRVDKPVKQVADYQGLKMRTSGTAQAAMYKALGAIPVELSSKEVYTALQRGTIMGATAGTSRFRRSKYFEVTPYITVDPTLPYLTFWLVINKDAWNKLSPEDQKIFQEAGREIEEWTRQNAAKERGDDLTFLKKEVGTLFELPPSDVKKLVTKVTPVMKKLSTQRLGSYHQELWQLLEKTK